MTAIAAASSGAVNIKPTLKIRAGLVVGGLLFGALAFYLASTGNVTHVFALALVFLPVVLWKRPYLAPAVLLSAAILVEQSGGIPRIPITQNIPLFQGIGPGHLQGADLLLLMVAFIYFVKSKAWGPRWFPHTHVSVAVRALVACVVLAIVVGHLHHGDLRTALMEARPFTYLVASYYLTSVLVRDRRAMRAVLWAFVGSTGFKALQGIYVWSSALHLHPKPESYISHEASQFFVVFIILVGILWLFDQKGRLRQWATWLLPVVIFADVVNNRRASWEMLGAAVLCLGVIAYQALPIRRRVLGKAIVALALLSAVYFPVMWNASTKNSFSAPARAIKSQVSPSARDASSDVYRVQENANLEFNIRQSAPLGTGFGVKINYALPIDDLSQSDPSIAWIPHNGVLWVLTDMGLLGGVAMWFLLAAAIITGFRLAHSRDREVAVIGALLACSMVSYALLGAVDQGFFWYRIAFMTGTLLGLGEAARRLAQTQPLLASASRVRRYVP